MFIAWKNFNDTIGHIVEENLWQPNTKWKLLLGLDQVVWFFILVNRKIISQQHLWIYLFYLILNSNYCFFIKLLFFKYVIKYLYAWINDFNWSVNNWVIKICSLYVNLPWSGFQCFSFRFKDIPNDGRGRQLGNNNCLRSITGFPEKASWTRKNTEITRVIHVCWVSK